MSTTTIEWADEVWNPVTGCTKVSQGCKHCYAERIAERFWGGRLFTDIRLVPAKLNDPFHWKKPRRVFVNSMSDLFHEQVPFEFVARVWATMAGNPKHRFMVLTKRAQRMYDFVHDYLPTAYDANSMLPRLIRERPFSNIWLGISAETQADADRRIPILLQTPAARRFVSIEPMLGPISLQGYDGKLMRNYLDNGARGGIARRGPLDWVILGGESGPGARPMHPGWARTVRDQCVVAEVPFFFKQWGEWKPISEMDETEYAQLYHPAPKLDPEATLSCKIHNHAIGFDGGDHWQKIGDFVSYLTFQVGKKTAGRLLDGIEWNQEPIG